MLIINAEFAGHIAAARAAAATVAACAAKRSEEEEAEDAVDEVHELLALSRPDYDTHTVAAEHALRRGNHGAALPHLEFLLAQTSPTSLDSEPRLQQLLRDTAAAQVACGQLCAARASLSRLAAVRDTHAARQLAGVVRLLGDPAASGVVVAKGAPIKGARKDLELLFSTCFGTSFEGVSTKGGGHRCASGLLARDAKAAA